MKKMYEIPDFTEYRSRRILELCEYLTPVMNEIHDINYSFRFWATLLRTYVKTCVNRENLMSEKILENKPVLLPYNGWDLPTKKDRWKNYLRYHANFVLKSSSINEVHDKIRQDNNICLGLRAKYLVEYGIGVYCPDHFPLCAFNAGRKKRENAQEIADQKKIIFHKNIIRQIPRFYVEYFDQLINKIELINPAKKTFHAEHISAFMKMLIAVYVEHGSKYYRYQYGGFVGETEQSVAEVNYIDIDRLRTYGWKINKKDEPFKAFRLEQFREQYKKINGSKIYDAAVIYNQINRVSQKKRYKKLSEKFFHQIDHIRFSKILLRPRGFTRKLDNSGELSFLELPSFITVDKGKKPMADIVQRTGIVVHLNHPSTNFLECVYVNHPVVAILTNNEATDIVKPFYQFFLDEKVMHPDIDSLIIHLNNENLDIWWNDVIKKQMYKAFKEQFAKKV